MAEEQLDSERATAFGDRMLALLNDAALVLMTSIGHRTGLFDTMAGLEWTTSERLAETAGLNERYVREWLGAMVTGAIVQYDVGRGLYRLPPEHAAFLTREATPGNMAATAQWIPVLAGVENRIVECFRHGGGVPYSEYARFHDVMAEESDQTTRHGLIDHILPVVPGLLERLRSGIDVLDVGCGRGRAVNLMALEFPESRFVGYDFSADGIAGARAEAAKLGLENARFETADAARFDESGAYDLITTFDAVHDQVDPLAVLVNIHRALRSGGIYLMQDIGASSHVHENIDHPMGPFLYTISCLHCMTVSLAAQGKGLGAMWGDQQARAYLRDAGFDDVELHSLPHDIQNFYYVCTKR